MCQTFSIRNSKIRIMRIQVFDVLKTNDIQFKFSDKRAYVSKCIDNYIFLTLNVLDHIGKRFNKFTPFGMTLVQFSLTF